MHWARDAEVHPKFAHQWRVPLRSRVIVDRTGGVAIGSFDTVSVLRVMGGRWSRLTQAMWHPVRVVALVFLVAIFVGSGLLMLPVASSLDQPTPLATALFTATSAVCVTGLVVVDTGSHWSGFGEAVILALIQIGGFGVMTLGTLVVILMGRRLSVQADQAADLEHQGFRGADAQTVIVGIAKATLLIEGLLTLVLALRFWLAYDQTLGRAVYLGFFHAVSAFNNAGFALWPDSLSGFAGDPWVCLSIATAIILGGIGFPVLWELRRKLFATWSWSLHTWLTVTFTGVLLVASTIVFVVVEWSNPATMGALSSGDRVMAGFFHAVNTRTAGFNTVPTGDLQSESLLLSDVLMFIGGGSGGTAGGIKVATFAVLAFVILAELRGDRSVRAWLRSIPASTQRQAVTVALLSVGLVAVATWTLLVLTPLSLDVILFEVTSAFGTVGLSTGITAQLPAAAQMVLVVLMFIGRVGPLTIGAALALRSRAQTIHYPEDRPIIG